MNVREMRESDFEEVYDTFLVGENLHDSPEGYRPLFSTRWSSDATSFGFVMENAGRIVGVLGTLYSDRLIKDRYERFCNLHTWFVKAEYRGYSLALMRPVTRLKNCTITDLSPSRPVVQISKRLGFQELDSRLTILLPFLFRSRSQITFPEPADDPQLLSDQERRILADHASLSCGQLLVSSANGGRCLIVYRTIRQRLHYCYLDYVSNWECFEKHSLAIRRELTRRSGCRLVAVNRRSLSSKRLPATLTLPVGIPQLYKSSSVEPSRIDTLYSEILINNWPLVLDTRSGLRALTEKWGWLREDESLKQRIGRLLHVRKKSPAPPKAT